VASSSLHLKWRAKYENKFGALVTQKREGMNRYATICGHIFEPKGPLSRKSSANEKSTKKHRSAT
jgi:hypothetical protein